MNDKTKKIMMLILVSVYCLLNLPAGAFSETKKIDPTSVKNIEIELLFENLTVSTKVPYGKLDIKKMNARIVNITPGPENSLANITADFFKIPLPDEADINISIPSESSFTILADSYHSKFINNFTGKVDSWARDAITYKHNGGGPEINIRNFKGDITVGGKSK